MPSGQRVKAQDPLTVLVVSPQAEDHACLRRMCGGGECQCRLLLAGSRREALPLLRSDAVPLVVSERDLADGSWKDLWEQMDSLDHHPLLVVTSAQADSYLWAEVFNLGGYDVLAKPLDTQEILEMLGRVSDLIKRRHGAAAGRFGGHVASNPEKEAKHALDDLVTPDTLPPGGRPRSRTDTQNRRGYSGRHAA